MVEAAVLQSLTELTKMTEQLVPPTVPSQSPSYPISPEQATESPVYELQAPRVEVQPLPVVTQSGSQALHAVLVAKVVSASVQTYSRQALFSHLHF